MSPARNLSSRTRRRSEGCADDSSRGEISGIEVRPTADQWRWHTGSEINPPSTLTVWRDANPEVGRIHLPDGRVKVVYQRPERHIGFRPGGA